MPFELALLRALLAACAAALLLQALPALSTRLLDKALDFATVPVAVKIPRRRMPTRANFQTGPTIGPPLKRIVPSRWAGDFRISGQTHLGQLVSVKSRRNGPRHVRPHSPACEEAGGIRPARCYSINPMASPSRRTWSWTFDLPPEELWPVLADTNRFNEAMGLPPYALEETPQPNGTVLRRGKGKAAGRRSPTSGSTAAISARPANSPRGRSAASGRCSISSRPPRRAVIPVAGVASATRSNGSRSP